MVDARVGTSAFLLSYSIHERCLLGGSNDKRLPPSFRRAAAVDIAADGVWQTRNGFNWHGRLRRPWLNCTWHSMMMWTRIWLIYIINTPHSASCLNLCAIYRVEVLHPSGECTEIVSVTDNRRTWIHLCTHRRLGQSSMPPMAAGTRSWSRFGRMRRHTDRQELNAKSIGITPGISHEF